MTKKDSNHALNQLHQHHLQDDIDEDESRINKNDIENNFDIEDETPDWNILTKTMGSNHTHSSSSSGIPKRGDKDFEPDDTVVQRSTLQQSRSAMYDALSGIRGHHLKQKLIAIWIDDTDEKVLGDGYAVIPFIKGNYFRDIGKAYMNNRYKNCVRLNPYETVYLVERGSMIIYLGDISFKRYLHGIDDGVEFDIEEELQSIDLELLYSLAFNNARYTVDKYQIYSYLKRHGYLILEVNEDDSRDNEISQRDRLHRYESNKKTNGQWWTWTWKGWDWKNWIQSKWMTFPTTHSLHYLTTHYFKFLKLFKSLRLIESYQLYDSLKQSPPPPPRATNYNGNDYTISFNVWKPGSQFSKSNPSTIPDFQIVVVNSDKVKFPTLATIQRLFNQTKYNFSFDETEVQSTIIKKNDVKMVSKKQLRQQQRQKSNQTKLTPDQLNNIEYLKRRDNLLKYGHGNKFDMRHVVIGVINNGIINLVNVIENEFELRSEYASSELSQLKIGKIGVHGVVYNGDK